MAAVSQSGQISGDQVFMNMINTAGVDIAAWRQISTAVTGCREIFWGSTPLFHVFPQILYTSFLYIH